MSDNSANLRNYQIQLQQVEAALKSDPDNEPDKELVKLKKDLLEVIGLTKDLMASEGESDPSNSTTGEVTHNFEAGDLCLAPLSEDGQFYEGRVDDITSDGQCTVVFKHKKVSEVCLVSLLKPLGNKKRAKTSIPSAAFSGDATRLKRKQLSEQKDYLKKKQQKKKERLKELEEEREKDKMKWQSFNTKAFSKKLKGATSKSIFASPDSVSGRVGVGTCGVGGKPMTEFTHQEKWKKSAAGSSGLPSRLAHNHRYK